MQDSLERFAQDCAAISDLPVLWQYCLEFYHQHGIDRVGYYTQDGARLGLGRGGVVTDGFPEDFVCDYVGGNLKQVDPIFAFAQQAHRPFLWSDIAGLMALSADQRAYLERLAAAELGNGLALQVFGPNMRNGFVALGFADAGGRGMEQVMAVQFGAQASHMRFCELTAELLVQSFDLSPRECEVLEWVAQGKSNGVIAEILGISSHTVDTLMRRVFDKMGVNDRTTAALLGVGSGLVHCEALA